MAVTATLAEVTMDTWVNESSWTPLDWDNDTVPVVSLHEGIFVINNYSAWAASNCTLFTDGEQWKCDALIIVRRISASLSLLGCLGIIFIIWLFRRYQFFSQRLIVDLCISGILVSVSHFMGGLREDGASCNFEAFFLTLCEWCRLLWISCITCNIFMNAVCMKSTENFECAYHVISWSVPFLVAIVPLFGDYYGPAGAWCWVPESYPHWRLAIWYAPFFSEVSLQLLIVIIIMISTRRRAQKWEGTYNPELERAKQVMKEEVKPLSGYPLVYLLTSVVPVITGMRDIVHPSERSFSLCVLDNLLAPLTGFLNIIVFGLDRDTRSRLTWVQIKANFLTNVNPRPIIREISIIDNSDYFSDIQEIIND